MASPRNWVIVGGTKGLGLAAARIVLRDAGPGVATTIAVLGRTPVQEPGVEFIRADLATVRGCLDAAQAIIARFQGAAGGGVDTLIFSNGIISRKTIERTKDGIEEDLAVSYLSRFIMFQELAKANIFTGNKRVFVFGYPGEGVAPHDVNDLNFQKPNSYKQWPAHMNTVACNEAFSFEISRRYPGIKAYGLNPGLIQTGIRDNFHGGNATWKGWFVEKLISAFAVTTDQYAERVLKPLFLSRDLGEPGFAFTNKGRPAPAKGWVAEEANRIRAWEASQALVDGVLGGSTN